MRSFGEVCETVADALGWRALAFDGRSSSVVFAVGPSDATTLTLPFAQVSQIAEIVRERDGLRAARHSLEGRYLRAERDARELMRALEALQPGASAPWEHP